MFFENLDLVEDMSIEKQAAERNEDVIENQFDGIAYPDPIDDGLAWVLKDVAYFMLPGASKAYEFLDEVQNATSNVIKKFIPIPIPKWAKKIERIAQKIVALKITAWFYSEMLKFLPIIVCTVASIIAVISYLVELAKFFYVTPFVVAFSVTTRRTHKIFDFLVSGIAIFFKPILIVLFIFFALFAHSLVWDVFIIHHSYMITFTRNQMLSKIIENHNNTKMIEKISLIP